MRQIRSPVLRRSWLFVGGADREALNSAAASGADVLIQELEDFTPPHLLGTARGLCSEVLAHWKEQGVVATVRINPLEKGGREDLTAAMEAGADAILLPKADHARQISELDEAVSNHERALGRTVGSTEIVPNVELAHGLVHTFDICRASPRVTGALVASEDMAHDLGAVRSADMAELDHVRGRFHVDCTAAGVVTIDMPYTWSDVDGARRHAESARRLGMLSKSAVDPAHIPVINQAFTPGAEQVAHCRKLVAVFEAARAQGHGRVELDSVQVEMPTYRNALATLCRAEALGVDCEVTQGL